MTPTAPLEPGPRSTAEPVVLRFSGHLTRESVDGAGRSIYDTWTLPGGGASVVVDLEDVTNIDLGALLALIYAHQELRDRLVLQNPSSAVTRMLIACGLAPAVARSED